MIAGRATRCRLARMDIGSQAGAVRKRPQEIRLLEHRRRCRKKSRVCTRKGRLGYSESHMSARSKRRLFDHRAAVRGRFGLAGFVCESLSASASESGFTWAPEASFRTDRQRMHELGSPSPLRVRRKLPTPILAVPVCAVYRGPART